MRPLNESTVCWEPVRPVSLDVLGVEINWTPDGREFPEPVLKAIADIYDISRLVEGWDSYGAKAAERRLGAPCVEFDFRGP